MIYIGVFFLVVRNASLRKRENCENPVVTTLFHMFHLWSKQHVWSHVKNENQKRLAVDESGQYPFHSGGESHECVASDAIESTTAKCRPLRKVKAQTGK